MAASYFDKEFIIDSKKIADSLSKIIAKEAKSIEIDRSLTSPEKERQGR